MRRPFALLFVEAAQDLVALPTQQLGKRKFTSGPAVEGRSCDRMKLSILPAPLACVTMTQDSRQVLIELLFLSLYLDNHLSLAEDEVFSDALDSLGWDSPFPRDKFIFSAFIAAREASMDAIKTDAFLDARTRFIKRDGEEGPALTWLYRVLGADGISPTEKWFLSRIESRLYP